MPIIVLEPQVVSRIAAGEVVERPASVVKELVENSLDAGSSQIAIETRDGGTSLIRVADNGTGIPAGEVALAFDRYATSKISRFEDLGSIHSLGFRGEALPSIAAVAQVDIVTRARDEAVGSYLTVKDGTASSRGGQGRSPGTTIAVRNLFRQVPARLKFLKSRSTENSHIANLVSQYALAFPEVRFQLSIDGRIALRTAGSSRLIDSIAQVYGLEVARNMLEVGGREDEWESEASVKVTGMIGSPSVSRSGRGYLSFFVNRRWINSRLLAWSVEEAYHGLLMSGKHPIAVINISLPPAEVDINIHPAKTEVKFQNEHQVFGAVQKAVRRALVEQAPVPRMEEPATNYLSPPVPGHKLWASPENRHSAATSPSAAPQTAAASLPVLRVLGQLSSSYIIAEGPDGLYLIDQHAAHERILFDQVKRLRSLPVKEVQGLLEPVTLEVNPKQEEVLKLHYEDLAESGFAIEPFGNRTYLVRAVPALIYKKDWMGMVRELLDSVTGENQVDWREGLAMSMACHGAVKAGQSLTSDEMRELIRQLEQATVPQTCPHGRPTMIRLGSEQLRREFGRS
jgi:DNA mismatch repair protein MutL